MRKRAMFCEIFLAMSCFCDQFDCLLKFFNEKFNKVELFKMKFFNIKQKFKHK